MSKIRAALLAASALVAVHAQTQSPCPKAVPEKVVCYTGADSNGAYYLILMPNDWNGTLVLYIHGGPGFTPPTPQILASPPAAAVFPLLEGAAVAASAFRDYGYTISEAAEDTENLRRILIDAFGPPKRTVAMADSFGGNVAARLMELYGSAADGSSNYDGAVIRCGTVAGYRRLGCAWVDFRTVYQYYCHNLPLPEEKQFDLWWGLSPDTGRGDQTINQATTQMVRDRANACTGFLLPSDQRSVEQQQNSTNILKVIRIPESQFQPWISTHTTIGLYDIATRQQGQNAFSNLGVVYQGSTDDDGLNSRVARYGPDVDAMTRFAAEADPTGKITAPVLTLHGIGDDQVVVENETMYRKTMEEAGTANLLFQTYVNTQGHCVYSTSELQATMRALLNWIDTGVRPTQDDIAASCEKYRGANGDQCRFVPDYQPHSWESRVYPRTP